MGQREGVRWGDLKRQLRSSTLHFPSEAQKQACLRRFADEPVAEIVQCGEPAI
jgi:hypothetical protein